MNKFNITAITLLLCANGYAQVQSLSVTTQNSIAPVMTSSTVVSQPATTLQLNAAVLPVTASQSVNWSVISGGTASATVSTSGLVTVPNQTSGAVWIKAVSVADNTIADSIKIVVNCKPLVNTSSTYKFDTVQIPGTSLNHNTPFSNSSYNYIAEAPASTATLVAGQAYTLRTVIRPSVMSETPYSYSLWIDYNRNGLFESSEYQSIIGDAGTTDTVTNFTITIPTAIDTGKTLMRLKTRLAGGDNSATSVCGNLTFSGHIQDFIVNLVNTAPLPVKLSNFAGSVTATQNALLHWETDNEVNNKGFYIQRSTDGENWTAAGWVSTNAANGYSAERLSYQYLDAKIKLSSKTYYRLRQVDADGFSTFSNIIALTGKLSTNNEIVVYPNPVTDVVYITIPGMATQSGLVIYNIDGVAVRTGSYQTQEIALPLGQLPKGVYILKVTTGENALIRKLIKQ